MGVATHTAQRSEVEPRGTVVDARPADNAIEQPDTMPTRIAAKAFALYEERGRREGYALQDWLDAEYIVNQELYDTH